MWISVSKKGCGVNLLAWSQETPLCVWWGPIECTIASVIFVYWCGSTVCPQSTRVHGGLLIMSLWMLFATDGLRLPCFCTLGHPRTKVTLWVTFFFKKGGGRVITPRSNWSAPPPISERCLACCTCTREMICTCQPCYNLLTKPEELGTLTTIGTPRRCRVTPVRQPWHRHHIFMPHLDESYPIQGLQAMTSIGIPIACRITLVCQPWR